MIWPWRPRRRDKDTRPGTGPMLREALKDAQRDLDDAVRRRRQVDRLATEVRRALRSPE